MTLITPLPDEGLGNTSWLVDLGDSRVAVIDPGRHPAPYLAAAERLGARVAFSVETHLHADFVSGHRELAERTGAEVVFGAKAGPAVPHLPVRDGDEIRVGAVVLRFLTTRSTASSCSCPTTSSSTPRTARARSAAGTSRATRGPRSASSAAPTTRCSRWPAPTSSR